jgi:hypothetical protein
MIEALKKRRLAHQIRKGVHSAVQTGSSAFWQFIKPTHEISHFSKLNPSDSQGHLPSCVGHALANYLEWVLRHHLAAPTHPFQIDGRRIWKESIQLTGRKNTGLNRFEVLAGVIGSLLPSTTMCRYIQSVELFDCLQKGPVILAMSITDQWINADRKNGFIPPGGVKGEAHAVLLAGVSAVSHSDGPFVHILNSWGLKNGMDGIVTLCWEEFKRAYIESWVPEFDQSRWCVDGNWKKWVIYQLSI